MPAKRMNREEFFAKLSSLDEDGLRKALWDLYWRGSAPLRERIEGELDPAEHVRRRRAAAERSRPLEWCMGHLLSCDRFVLGGRVGVT